MLVYTLIALCSKLTCVSIYRLLLYADGNLRYFDRKVPTNQKTRIKQESTRITKGHFADRIHTLRNRKSAAIGKEGSCNRQ